MHKIRREKRTTISEVIVRGKREILSKINKIGIGFISIFLLKARFSYLTILKNLKDETPRGGGVLPYMGYIGMCRCEGYGFQAVYSSIGCINQSVWV